MHVIEEPVKLKHYQRVQVAVLKYRTDQNVG